MNFRLTRHAADAMSRRGIAPEWVQRVRDAPESTEPDRLDPALEHRLGRISECGDRVLRVVSKAAGSQRLAITVYFDRGMRGKL